MPFYRYWKDNKGEFIIDIAYDSGNRYTVNEILEAFPVLTPKEWVRPIPIPQQKIFESRGDSGDFWVKANQLPVYDSLQKLSGTEYVNFEKYLFIRKKDHTRIIINGKPSNAWIDRNGKIGSTDGAAPAIPNWLYWYQRDWKKVAEIIKKEFFNA